MKTLPWILLLIIVSVVSIYECSRKPEIVYETIHTQDTVWQQVVKEYTKVVIQKEDSLVYDTIWKYLPVDTAKILEDYFVQRFYNNKQLVDDTLVTVTITAMVTQNRLQWIEPTVTINTPIITHYHYTLPKETIKPRPWGFAAGAFGYSHPTVYDIGAVGQVRYYNLSFGYGRGLNKSNLFTILYNF